jgi:hypothetical protein
MVTNRLAPSVERTHGARPSLTWRTANAYEGAYPIIRLQHLREASSPSLRNRSLITSVQSRHPPSRLCCRMQTVHLFQLPSSSSFLLVLLTAIVTMSCCRGRTLRLPHATLLVVLVDRKLLVAFILVILHIIFAYSFLRSAPNL